MSAGEVRGDMLDQMIDHELAAAELYHHYAQLFRSRDNPWEEMMQEERAHADVLKTLRTSLDRLSLTRSPMNFPNQTLQASVEFIRKETTLAQSGPMSMLRALSVCLSIEQSAIEHEFFQVFQPVSDAMKQEFSALAMHTSDHVQRIEECLVQEHALQTAAAPVSRVNRFGRRFTFLPV